MTNTNITNIRFYNIVTQWGTKGNGEGQFSGLNDVIVTTDNSIFVPDYENHRIQKFLPDGQFVSKWGSEGTGNSQFLHPHGLDVDAEGNVYVTDAELLDIQKFTIGETKD
jgi:hypothetical protein